VVINQAEVGDDTLNLPMPCDLPCGKTRMLYWSERLRDLETITTALNKPQKLAILFFHSHTSSAAQTIDRAIDVFPPHQQQQVRIQLAAVLQGDYLPESAAPMDGSAAGGCSGNPGC